MAFWQGAQRWLFSLLGTLPSTAAAAGDGSDQPGGRSAERAAAAPWRPVQWWAGQAGGWGRDWNQSSGRPGRADSCNYWNSEQYQKKGKTDVSFLAAKAAHSVLFVLKVMGLNWRNLTR